MSLYVKEKDEIAYRIYVTDNLYALNRQDIAIEKKFSDIAYKELFKDSEDNRTGDEIAKEVIESAGLKVL